VNERGAADLNQVGRTGGEQDRHECQLGRAVLRFTDALVVPESVGVLVAMISNGHPALVSRVSVRRPQL
jgi:hypothetical protein